MNSLKPLLKRLGQVLTVFVLGAVLLFTTACNNGDLRGARPNNPPVQMGGQNNPHKMGGDGYTNYKASTDARAKNGSNLRSSADLQGQLIASSDIKSNASDLLYPGDNATRTSNPDIGVHRDALKAEPIPAPRQNNIDRSDPDQKIMEKIGQQFQDASSFLKESFDAASDENISKK